MFPGKNAIVYSIVVWTNCSPFNMATTAGITPYMAVTTFSVPLINNHQPGGSLPRTEVGGPGDKSGAQHERPI